jgi:hypothetical protein
VKDDPFAKLSGLDQRLFSAPSGQAPGDFKKALTEERTSGRSGGRTSGAPTGGMKERRKGHSFEPPQERPVERRPYDFYADQVRWLNRMKVDVEERYRRKITSNAMVQLALDLFIADYRARGPRSYLITRLVLGERSNPDGETSERPEGGA